MSKTDQFNLPSGQHFDFAMLTASVMCDKKADKLVQIMLK